MVNNNYNCEGEGLLTCSYVSQGISSVEELIRRSDDDKKINAWAALPYNVFATTISCRTLQACLPVESLLQRVCLWRACCSIEEPTG